MDNKDKNKRKKQIKFTKEEIGEDVTQHGEFISSFFGWETLEQQKKRVDKLEDITEEDDKNKKKDN